MADLGSDLSGVEDLTPQMLEVSGRLCAVQAWARRLITARASLVDDPNYGYDLTDWIDADATDQEIGEIQGGVDEELTKDERCLSCSSTVTFLSGKLRVVAVCQDADGPFRLTLEVTNVDVKVLEVT